MRGLVVLVLGAAAAACATGGPERETRPWRGVLLEELTWQQAEPLC